MAVKLIATIQRFTGLSTDTKPTGIRKGSTFLEFDTGKKLIWQNSEWREDTSGPVSVNAFNEAHSALRRLAELQYANSIANEERGAGHKP